MNIAVILRGDTYRFSLFTLTIISTLTLFYFASEFKENQDAFPDIKPITTQKFKEWGGQDPGIIKTGLYVTNFPSFDVRDGRFVMEGIVWFEFNASVTSLEMVSKFDFDKAKLIKKELLDSKIVGELLYVRYSVLLEFTNVLNYKYFPLDRHRVYLTIKNDFVTPQEMILRSYYTRAWFADNIVTLNWRYSEPGTYFGYIESLLDTSDRAKVDYTPIATFFFDFERASIRGGLLVLMIPALIFFLVLSTLLLCATSITTLILHVMGVITLFMYRLIVQGMAPEAGYFLLSDYVFLLSLVCALSVFLAELTNIVYKRDEHKLSVVRSSTLTFSSLFFLGGWFYLLLVW